MADSRSILEEVHMVVRDALDRLHYMFTFLITHNRPCVTEAKNVRYTKLRNIHSSQSERPLTNVKL